MDVTKREMPSSSRANIYWNFIHKMTLAVLEKNELELCLLLKIRMKSEVFSLNNYLTEFLLSKSCQQTRVRVR